jgi:hypothetical protein
MPSLLNYFFIMTVKEKEILPLHKMPYSAEVCFLYSPGCPWCQKFKNEPTGWEKVKSLLPQGTTKTIVDVSKFSGRHPYMHPQNGGVPQVAFVINNKPVDWHIGYTDDAWSVVRRLLRLENERLQKQAMLRQDNHGKQMLQRAMQFLP